MIEFSQVTRKYGNAVAVDGLDLSIPPGELFACLGPNGAGKTTTIKMLVGLLRPTQGSVCVDGLDLSCQSRKANRRLGYVPDQPFLYDKLTGREFLQFIAEMHGLTRSQSEACIERELDRFELHEFADQLAESYSHGMKQRTVFAAQLLHDPSALVLDEPMVGLDPRSMRMVKDLLQAEAQRGMTVFMSTHTLGVVEEIADRIAVMSDGRLRFLGTVSELREQMAMAHGPLESVYLKLMAEDESSRSSTHSPDEPTQPHNRAAELRTP